MSWNIEAYSIYLGVTAYITIVVGYMFHKYGFFLILNLFNGNVQAAKSINNLLLVAYYLVNLGYLAISISTWPELLSIVQVLQLLFHKISLILLVLGILHFNNIFWLNYLSRRKDFIKFLTH